MPKIMRLALRFAPVLVGAVVLAGCPSSDPTDPDPGPATLALVVSPTSATVEQGASTTISATATAGGAFSGSPTLSVSGMPTGVTGSVSGLTTSGATTTGTVTIQAAASTTPGSYGLTVRAQGSGAPDATAALTLTVTAAPSYALSLSGAALSISQGASGTSTVTIARTNFAGAVTLDLGGAPTGVTGSFAPAAPTGTSSTLTVSVAGSVAAGTYDLTVNGTGTAGNRSTPLALTVTAGGGGGPTQVTIDFAACPSDLRPVWLAYQDGSGAWVRVTGASDAYTFELSEDVGGVAFVNDFGEDGTEVQIHYMTAAELAALTTPLCYLETSETRFFHTGTLAGLGAGDLAHVGMGGYWTPALTAGSPITLGVPAGMHDLVGFRSNPASPATARGLLRRDVTIGAAGSFGTVDFTGSESFAAAFATITIGGLAGGEVLVHNTSYYTGAMCRQTLMSSGVLGGASFTAYGMPAAQQRGTDYHRMTIFAHSDATSDPIESRSVTESFNMLAPRTIAVGATIPTPSLSSLAGSYKRLQAAYTLSADYQAATSFFYEQVSIRATLGYFGGADVTLGMPDFAGVAGWNDAWAPATGGSSDWQVSASGGTAGSPCAENARSLTASRRGTF